MATLEKCAWTGNSTLVLTTMVTIAVHAVRYFLGGKGVYRSTCLGRIFSPLFWVDASPNILQLQCFLSRALQCHNTLHVRNYSQAILANMIKFFELSLFIFCGNLQGTKRKIQEVLSLEEAVNQTEQKLRRLNGSMPGSEVGKRSHSHVWIATSTPCTQDCMQIQSWRASACGVRMCLLSNLGWESFCDTLWTNG